VSVTSRGFASRPKPNETIVRVGKIRGYSRKITSATCATSNRKVALRERERSRAAVKAVPKSAHPRAGSHVNKRLLNHDGRHPSEEHRELDRPPVTRTCNIPDPRPYSTRRLTVGGYFLNPPSNGAADAQTLKSLIRKTHCKSACAMSPLEHVDDQFTRRSGPHVPSSPGWHG
jgi:hypothetical protein